MKESTKLLISELKIRKLKYDEMGYEYKNINNLSFHHLIIPKRDCKGAGLGEGYQLWNGAILVQDTSHDYLHRIEKFDYDRFMYITSELIDINIQRAILYENLKRINDCLESFEKEYQGKYISKHNPIIKYEYTKRLLKK